MLTTSSPPHAKLCSPKSHCHPSLPAPRCCSLPAIVGSSYASHKTPPTTHALAPALALSV